jgi:hypothetical protein
VVLKAVVDLDHAVMTPGLEPLEGNPELSRCLQSPDLRGGLRHAVSGERYRLACHPLLVLGPGPSVATAAGEAVP